MIIRRMKMVAKRDIPPYNIPKERRRRGRIRERANGRAPVRV